MKSNGKIYYGWIVVIVCFVIMFTCYTPVVSLMNIFLKDIVSDLKVGRAVVIFANTLSQLVSLSCAVLFGSIIHKFDLKKTLLVAVITHLIAFASLSIASSIIMYYASYVVIGVTSLVIFMLVIPQIINNWFIGKKGLALGIVLTGSGFGGLLLSNLSAKLLVLYGWRDAIQIMGAVAFLITMPLIIFLLKAQPSDCGLEPYIDNSAKTINKCDELDLSVLAKTKVFYFHGISLMLFMAALSSMIFSMQPYLTDQGYSVESAASIQAIYTGSLIIGKIVLGRILDIKGGKVGGVFALVLFVLCASVVLFINSPIFLILYILFYMIGGSAGTVLSPFSVVDIYGKKQYSKINGKIVMFTSIGGAIGVTLSGLFYDIFNNYIYSFVFDIILVVIAIFLYSLAYQGRDSYIKNESRVH